MCVRTAGRGLLAVFLLILSRAFCRGIFRGILFGILAGFLLRALPGYGQTATIPAGVPLRIEIEHRSSTRIGTHLEGQLIAPVYLVDHQVLPAGLRVQGMVLGSQRIGGSKRTQALLNGDFTPLARPEITFDTLVLADGRTVALHTRASERTAAVVRMKSGGKGSMKSQVEEAIRLERQQTMETIHKPHLGDRVRKYLYAQLPYHPQNIWAGTQYDAELTEPLEIPEPSPPKPLPVEELQGQAPTGILQARLTKGVDSATAHKGDAVEAVLTKPLLDKDGKRLVLAEGTRMKGTVVQAQHARWFARHGKLRFTFREIETAAGSNTIHGQLAGAEASPGQNVNIDSEGAARSTSGPNKYFAPLALGVLAVAAAGDDGGIAKDGVVSNGFGLGARIASMTAASQNVARGFAYFALAKSIYYRWIAKGSEISFPRNTRIEIVLNKR